VLLDLTIPGMTGQEVALKPRENNATAGALIVAISGYGDQDAPSGCDRLLVKPVHHKCVAGAARHARG
jgi:CheY-like chemotaxis protein